MAFARAITFDGYGTNERLSMQWDPDRMTAFLPRWEKILGITPAPTATDKARRDEVRKRFRRFIEATAFHSRLITRLKNECGDLFVQVEYIDVANAVVHAPDPSYPWGSYVDGVPWYSTVAHILVLLQKPAGYTEADFYAVAGRVIPAVDGLIPAWSTIDWYRAPTGYPAISVSGGPSQAGFYLDADANLDNSVFDSYSPLSEAGCTCWLDASKETTGKLYDLSGNANDFAGSGVPPTLVAGGINGKSAHYYDGNAYNYQTGWPTKNVGSLIAASEFTIFGVWKPDNVDFDDGTIGNQGLFTLGSQTAGLQFRSSNLVVATHRDGGGWSFIATPSLMKPGAPHFGYMRHSGGVIYVSVDGAPEVSVVSADTFLLTEATIIGQFSLKFKGYIGSLIFYNVSLSAAAIARMSAYLRSEWLL